MKKCWHIALMLLCVLFVSSCGGGDDDEIIDDVWKVENEAAFAETGKSPGYFKLLSEANNGFVYYKPIKNGDGKQVYYNSKLKVYYKGSLIDGTVFDHKEFDDGIPFSCTPSPTVASEDSKYSSVISGWTVALQHMVEGDKWEVWIPQGLGYGSTAYGSIPAYSTLIFEIEVVEVVEQ